MGGLGKVGNERSESKRLLIDCPSYLSSCAGHDVGPKGLRDSGSTVPCGATGITKTPENTVNPSHQQALAPILLHDTCTTDPDLAAVVDAWPDLPEAIRAGILAMVKAALGKGGGA